MDLLRWKSNDEPPSVAEVEDDDGRPRQAILVYNANTSAGGGAGDASAANQDEQTALLTTMESNQNAEIVLLAAIDGHVDGLEGLIGTTNSSIAALASAAGTAANQTTQIQGVGNPSEAASTAGGTGSLSAKMRLMTSQLNALLTGIILGAGENVIGKVGGNQRIIDVVFTLDTNIYAADDVLADTQAIAGAARINDGVCMLQTLILNCKDDVAVEMTLHFFSANTSLGTENEAPSISDVGADTWLGSVPILDTDWMDLGGMKVCEKSNLGKLMKPVTSGTTVYVAIQNGSGTPTLTVNGITARFGFMD